ncbi:hypothetical protein [Paenibacillus sp. NRS-1781]|uniref:hypothetical protein n=1 Tax=Paenibacillus sp. NRS-1781 TaxID=3233905 RepID=UPI003D26E953
MIDYDDFYGEPSEFEQKWNELKGQLMDSVKDEHKQEVARLRKENAELREVKSNLDETKHEHNQKLHELDLQKRDLERVVRKERLDQLMGDFKLELWVPESDYKLGEKCDKCDDNRRFHYKTPMGRNDSETCGCAVKIPYYKPELYTVYSFGTYDNGSKLRPWYRKKYRDQDYYESDSSYAAEAIYEGETFEEFRKKSEDEYRAFFKDKDDCQAYCEWLAERRKEEMQNARL